MSRTQSSRRAFTLVELLVVIGIIALLISILLPTLGRVRETANSVKCQSNIKQIALAYMMYSNDSGGKGMTRPNLPGLTDGGGYIMYVLTENGYLNLQQDPQIQICPSGSEEGTPGTAYGVGPATQVRIGGAGQKWYRNFDSRLESEGSYTYNGWVVYGNNQSGSGTTIQANQNRGEMFYINISRVKQSSIVPFMGDGVWSEGFALERTLPSPTATDPFRYAIGNGISGNISDGQINRWYLARHAKRGINMAFADGHVEPINNLYELWKMSHHAKWDTTLVPQNVRDRW